MYYYAHIKIMFKKYLNSIEECLVKCSWKIRNKIVYIRGSQLCKNVQIKNVQVYIC